MDDSTKPTLSIVVPVFQNEANLPETIRRLVRLRAALTDCHLEILFVDDGSRDRSMEIIAASTQEHPGLIKGIRLTRNFGQTPAIQAGLHHAKGACVGIISADLQEPSELFVDMVAAWKRGGKFIMGERRDRAEGWAHRLTSGTYWRMIRRFAFPDFPSMGYDFCLLDRQVVEDLNRIHEKNSSIFVLIYWLGYQAVRLPVTRQVRTVGRSQWRLAKKVSFTVDTLIGFTYLPARLITVMSFALATASLGYLTFSLLNWHFRHLTPPGWMTQIGVVTLLGAAISFALGIISEYLLRILDETRKRPPYVVERIIE